MGEREKREDLERKQREIERKETKLEENKEHTCLWLLFNFLKALGSRLDSAVKRCSI